jgi:hypothetical protein
MALTGHLSDLSLSELIEFFCNQRKTGQLKVLYPQGSGHFYLQTGSVVDARIGVLRGIDAVYFALTLPNAKFEFGGDAEPTERTINQPWTQVVLEGLRRLDEGIVPPAAFPPDYQEQSAESDSPLPAGSVNELEKMRVPSFLSLMGSDSAGKRKFAIAGAVAVVVIASVAAIGVPAGWYSRAKVAAASQPPAPVAEQVPPAEMPKAEVQATSVPSQPDEAALAAKRQHEKEREKAKAREEKAALNQSVANSAGNNVASESSQSVAKSGAKKITVTVTYDESGRVTQASGGDASAVRIARQKRFPAGKAGSATITIPIN